LGNPRVRNAFYRNRFVTEGECYNGTRQSD
jgi:hypothetical protein